MTDKDRPSRVQIGKLESKNNRGPGAFIGEGVDVSIDHADLSRNSGGGLIVGSDVVGQLALLGLPPDVPPQELVSLLEALRDSHGKSGDERRSIIRRSAVWEWIGRAADTDAVMHLLIQAAASPLAHAVIQRLRS